MKTRFLFIVLYCIVNVAVYSDDVDIGEIEVVEEITNEQEKTEEPEKFTTIIIPDTEDQGKNISEILSESSEVFVKETGGEAGVSTVSIRGSSSKNVLILIDGIPLNSGGKSSVDISMIPVSSIERIEIIRGGDAALYGSGAMGGVINIVTKKPNRKFFRYDLQGPLFTGLDSIFSAGEKTNEYNIFFSGQFKYDNGNFLYYDNNGTEFNKTDDTIKEREHNDARKTSFLINNILYFPKEMSLGLNLNYTNKNNSIGGPLTFENHFAEARLDNNLLIAGIYYNLGNLNQYFTNSFHLNYKLDNYTYTNQNEYGGGYVFEENSLHYLQFQSNTQIFSIPSNILHITGDFSYQFMKNAEQRLELAGIIRDEFYFYDDRIGILPTARLQYNSDLNRNIQFFWSLGAFFLPIEPLKIKINGFYAIRNPDFYEMYYTSGQYVGNPDLNPESSYGGDLGFHLNKDQLFLEMVLFCTYYENLIQYLLSHGFVFKPMNLDAVLSYGGEFRLNLDILKMFNFQLGYTFNLLNNLNDLEASIIKQLPGHPIHSLMAKLKYNFNFLTIESQLKFEDQIGITQNNLKFIPPKVLIDILLKMNFEIKSYHLKPSFFISANNILNIYTVDIRNYPLEGFHIDLGCSLEF